MQLHAHRGPSRTQNLYPERAVVKARSWCPQRPGVAVVALTDHLIGCTAGTTLLSVGVATPSKAVPCGLCAGARYFRRSEATRARRNTPRQTEPVDRAPRGCPRPCPGHLASPVL